MTIAQVLARAAREIERNGPPMCRVRKNVPCLGCALADSPVDARKFLMQFSRNRWEEGDVTAAEAVIWLSSAAEWAQVRGE